MRRCFAEEIPALVMVMDLSVSRPPHCASQAGLAFNDGYVAGMHQISSSEISQTTKYALDWIRAPLIYGYDVRKLRCLLQERDGRSDNTISILLKAEP
jgi:hypothetical protein